jgi:hypothetical protein
MKSLGNHNLNHNNNPKQNIQMENELLELKLRAEKGTQTHFMGNISPELQNVFLKNIIAFEESFSKRPFKSLFEILNKPVYPAESELNDHALEIAYKSLIKILDNRNIDIFYQGEYSLRTKYKFITEELFYEEIPCDDMLNVMRCCFNYEEFHPNHALDIEDKTISFIDDWMEHKLDNKHPDLAESFIFPNGKILHKDEITIKIINFFKSFKEFKNCKYSIEEINFDLSPDTRMGFAEGYIKYTAVLYDNEEVQIEGPYKIYYSLDYGCWTIVYFVFPGFN